MEFINYTAKTVDEAITQACLSLGVTSDRLDYKVIQEATSGFLGIRSKPAIISARARSEEEIENEKKAAEAAVKAAKEAAEKAEKEAKAAAEKAAAEKEAAKNAASKAVSEERHVITSDEIEKRASEAAARAKAEGRTEEERPEHREEGRGKREGRERGRKNDRGRRDDRRDDRRQRREAAPVVQHEPSKPKPERVIKERSEEEIAVLKQTAETFLKDVFKAMNIDADMTTSYDAVEGAVNCTFAGEEMGLLIGKRGQTLDSIQYLTSLVINKNTDDYVRVKLDTEDYRSRRADTLNNLARNIAYKVRKTRRSVALEPMNPYERRIIHSSLQGNKFVETYSEGEEPYRHVVVAPKR